MLTHPHSFSILINYQHMVIIVLKAKPKEIYEGTIKTV